MSARYQLYFGGPIHTIDDHHPNVEAVAVFHGRTPAVFVFFYFRAFVRKIAAIDQKSKAGKIYDPS